MKSPIQLFVALAVMLATATVAAQVYKWVDKDGKVQYSDTPPPPSAGKADAKRINTGANSSAPAVSTAPGTTAAAANAPKSLQERSKDADKRRVDEAEKAKKDEEAQKIAKQNEERCKEATRFKSDLDSGRPIVRNNDKAERVFVSDEERGAEAARLKTIIAEACTK